MANIIVEKHLILAPNEQPAGAFVTSGATPGAVEIVLWADGVRVRAQLAPEEAINIGTMTILCGGQAAAIASGQQKAPEQPRIVTNGVGRG